jgi:hypothetical protein
MAERTFKAYKATKAFRCRVILGPLTLDKPLFVLSQL